MKSNPDQWLILDNDYTISGQEGYRSECLPGLEPLLVRQGKERNVAVYSRSGLASINRRLGDKTKHLDGIFSQCEPMMSDSDVLLFQGGLHHRSEVAEITGETKAQIQAAREVVVRQDHPTLVEELRILTFAYEFHERYKKTIAPGRVVSRDKIQEDMDSYPGDVQILKSSPNTTYRNFHFPFPLGTTLTPELENAIRIRLAQQQKEGSSKHQTTMQPLKDQLQAYRTQTNFEAVLNKYRDLISEQWTYKGSGGSVSADYYRNPYTGAANMDLKDLHRLRLRMKSEGRSESMKMVMIEDWYGIQEGSIHESDPLTPVLVVDPEDSGWIQRGAIEGLVERLFQHPDGPNHAFRAMLSNAPSTNHRYVKRRCSLTLDGHRFVLGEGKRGGFVGTENTPRNLKFFNKLS